MKCVSCNGEVASDQERCPYCNTINKEAVLNNKKIALKNLDNKKLKVSVLESSKEYIWTKFLNRTMVILAIIFCILLVINFASYLITSDVLKPVPESGDMTMLDLNYEDFISNRNACIEQIENKEILNDYNLEQTLEGGLEVLEPYFYNPEEMAEEKNQKILEEYQQSVMTFFQTYLKLDKKEINDLCQLKDSDDTFGTEFDEIIKEIRGRLGE